MVRSTIGILCLSGILAAGSAALAAEPAPELALAARIDQVIAARWAAAGVRPAPLADDAEYLRRVSLDLIGRIPSAAEARAFLTDRAPAKRTRLVRELLRNPAHVEHFVNVWRDLLLPEAATNAEVQAQVNGFNDWLRRQIAGNVGYDRMVRELLTVPFAGERVRPRTPARPRDAGGSTPLAFYLAKDVKPENLAGSTAGLFLGVKIECAQCHDHPSASWTRPQFWGYAAFFAGLQRDAGGGAAVREVFDRRELKIPGSAQAVEARFLDDTEPQWRFNVGARATLAEWLTAPTNPWFARAAANRLWAHFFGTGLVEPVDDLRPGNPPSHPELLDELARRFAAQRFDVPFLIRALTASRAYQLTSAAPPGGPPAAGDSPRLFARMAVRGLSPEQLFDSLALATGYRELPAAQAPGAAAPARSPVRAEFLALFANNGPARTEAHLSIQQALALMNGRFTAEATRLKDGTLAAVARDPALDTAGRIEALFLATLTRQPTPKERDRLVRYVDGGGPNKDERQALADVFWALLNSTEFMLNH
jgi:hypothetical protein